MNEQQKLPKELPIYGSRRKIVDAIRANQVTIVVGETGSGKTTQIPQYLYEAGFGQNGIIGVTEPRRIAATSVAGFVAEQLGTRLGDTVGYQIRFDDKTYYSTRIKFMTDGILLRGFQDDPDLSQYSVIMVDEAHERSANIDFTLGLLKDLLGRRSDLRVVVSSATIDAKKFSKYFGKAPIIEVSGRTFPVDIVWDENNCFEETAVKTVVDQIIKIHKTMPLGDILVFMTGADDINKVVNELEKRTDLNNLIALPAHGGLSPEKQQLIFQNFPGKRKVIVATNIAETSITIDGVVYVVDSGLIKQISFHPESGIQSLSVELHSQAGCDQRAGRAGRTRPGKCFRMFSKNSFERRPKFTEPEIRRMNLAGVVLAMKMIGIKDIEGFDFIDPPDQKAFHEAHQTLIALGALTSKNNGLTELGCEMAKLPLEPRISRMVLEAEKHGCLREITIIAAFLSVRSIFSRPRDKEIEADTAHQRFYNRKSDALTFLKVWSEYEKSGFDNDWCYRNFLNSRSLFEVKNIRLQLLDILRRRGRITSSDDEDVILKSVAAGLVQNLLEHGSRHGYKTLLRELNWMDSVFIHPGSALFGWMSPRWIVASTIVRTSKLFARGVSQVEVEWLPDLVPSRFQFSSIMLESYIEGDSVVLARRSIIKNGQDKIGSIELEIPLDQAREIQQDKIRRALDRGLVLVVFEEVPRDTYGSKIVGITDSDQYGLALSSGIYPQKGDKYYCELKKGLFENDLMVYPKFKVLDFPDDEKEAIQKNEQPVPKEVTKEITSEREQPMSTENMMKSLQNGLGGDSFI